jgi:hypothetical protein
MKHILWVRFRDDPSNKTDILHQALKSASSNQDIAYMLIDCDGTEQNFKARIEEVISHNRVDAVVVSSTPFGNPKKIEQKVPLFDLGYMFGRNDSDVCVFRGFPDGFPYSGFGIDKNGNFHGDGDKFGWNSMTGFGGWLGNKFGGESGAPPIGHLGGERGATETNETEIICALFGLAAGLAAKDPTPATAGVVGKICEIIINSANDFYSWVESCPEPKGPDGGPPIPKDAGPPPKEEPDDVSGKSYLLLIREWAAERERNRSLRQQGSGHVLPERTDVNMEFRAWLLRQTNPIINENGKLINPDDETGYSFLYKLFKSIWHDYQNNSFTLQYWWYRGAPIDPKSYGKSLAIRAVIKSPYILSRTRSDGSVALDFYM